MLEIKNLEKTYHAIHYQKALDGVSLTVAPEIGRASCRERV